MISPGQRDLAAFNERLRAYGESPRYWRLQALEAMWDGLQYDGRPSFWDATVPLRERAPVVQSQIVRAAGQRVSSLLFGERTFPAITVNDRGYGVTLSPAEKLILSDLVSELGEALGLRTRMGAMLEQGIKCGTAVAFARLCDGLPHLDLKPAKWCSPRLDARGSPREVVIEYQTLGTDGLQYVYRRVVGETADVTYPPVENKGRAIDWTQVVPDPTKTYGLEFCPATWVRSMGDPTSEGIDIDGCALFQGLSDEVEGLDFALSQLHRTAQYNGEPQIARIGVDGTPQATGVTSANTESRFSWFNSVGSFRFGGGAKNGSSAIRKAPGTIWDMPAGGDVKMVESTGAGAKIIESDVGALRRLLLDAVGVVMADPDLLGKGELSARALSLLYAPTLALADNLRAEWGAVLREIVNKFLRLCVTDMALAHGVHLASWRAAVPILRRFKTGGRWIDVPLALKWGRYFEPSTQEVYAAVQAASLGVKSTAGGQVMSVAHAVHYLAETLGTEDVDGEIAAILSASRETVGTGLSPTPTEITEVPPTDVATTGKGAHNYGPTGTRRDIPG